MTEHLQLSGVSHGYGDRQLFDGADLTISAGEHVAIVGENGAGKSTLLRILAGLEAPDLGTSVCHGTVGYLSQTLGLSNALTVRNAIDTALKELRGIEAELNRLEQDLANAEEEDLARYADLQTQYQLREGYAAESRVQSALDKLGLGRMDRGRTLGSLSGGEQERVALACLLADPADILLLDEPTNHLDASGTAWLETRLAAQRGTVVVVSHDRVLLRKVASTVIEVDAERRSVKRYGNGYEGYLREKAAERQRWVQQYHEWLEAMAAERRQAATVAGNMGYGRRRDGDKMGFDFKAGTWQRAATSKVRNAQERLRRLEESPVDRPPEPLRLFAGPGAAAGLPGAGLEAPGRPTIAESGESALPGHTKMAPASPGGAVVLEARGVVVQGRLDVPEFRLLAGQKVLVTGPNGAGKSTLLSVLAGSLEPARGTISRSGKIGYLQQELEPPAHPGMRLLPAFAAGLGGNIDEHAEALLRLGLFRPGEFHVPVGALSAGQQRRLALARLLLGGFETLIVDEPTNHLAPVLVEELEAALAGFGGTVVMVSHDRALGEWFRRQTKNGSGNWLRHSMENGRLLPASG